MFKKLISALLCLLTLHGYVHADTIFKFNSYKINDNLTPQFLQMLFTTFDAPLFIETGTYSGETSATAAAIFKTVHTIELHDGMYKKAEKKFSVYKNVKTYHGSSPEIFAQLLPTITETAVFWLDAHFSGDGTALSFDNQNHPEAITAIRAELIAIAKNKNICDNCIILIDDIRGFGTHINDQVFPGCWAYPTIQEVHELLLKINQNFNVVLLGDTVLAYDQTKYTPSFSPVAIACTQTRLYNGSNLFDQELMAAEKIIMNACDSEKAQIKHLYTIMTDWKDPMFLHDLWYGLVCLGEKNYKEAFVAFSKVPIRTIHFDTHRNVVDTTLRYDHWRIESYIQEAIAGVKNTNG